MVSIIKFRGGEINYLDSDATWHTLLTMQAYDETPISQHKFLPIVSLGGVDNKGDFMGAQQYRIKKEILLYFIFACWICIAIFIYKSI